MRVLITSDLHIESTGIEPIRRLVAGMDREDPGLVILAGDLGNPSRLFEQCLIPFLQLSCPVAVVPGNHDVWTGLGETSIGLYGEILPAITRSMGFHWLDDAPLVLPGGVGVCGSIAWYDYSAREASYNLTTEQIVAMKPRYAMDAARVDWEYGDQEFAAHCRGRLAAHLAALESNPAVDRVLVATHVPAFESQMERDPEDQDWSNGNAFFGHLTLGEEIRRFAKVRTVVSGHTHLGINGLVERPGMEPIATAVVPSDYGRPRWLELDL